MAYVSMIADLIGVFSGVYIFIVGIKGYLSKRKQGTDEAHSKRNQSRTNERTKDDK